MQTALGDVEMVHGTGGDGPPTRLSSKVQMYPHGFSELPLAADPTPPIGKPSSVAGRPFWLLRTLSLTILTGAQVTETLHIPREVWFQKSVRISALPVKMQACATLQAGLRELRSMDSEDRQPVLKALTEFTTACAAVAKSMAKALENDQGEEEGGDEAAAASTGSWGNRVKSLGRNAMANMLAGSSGKLDDATYVQQLYAVMDQVQVMDGWLREFSAIESPNGTEAAILDRLHTVSHFLETTVCPWVLRDLDACMERYMKKSRESFTRVFGKA